MRFFASGLVLSPISTITQPCALVPAQLEATGTTVDAPLRDVLQRTAHDHALRPLIRVMDHVLRMVGRSAREFWVQHAIIMGEAVR